MASMLEKLTNLEIEEENADIQEYHFHILDKIIDGSVLFRYKNNSDNKGFISIAHLYDTILAEFENSNQFTIKEQIKSLAFKMYLATSKKEELHNYNEKITEFYAFYQLDKQLPKELTTPFFNEILNKQQDTFCKWEKEWIKKDLCQTLWLTPKKEATIKNAIALKQMKEYFQEGKQEDLGLTKEQMLEITKEVSEQLRKIKCFKKDAPLLTEEILSKFGYLFFTGNFTKDQIEKHCNLSLSEKQVKLIRNQYNKKTLSIIAEHIPQEELSRENVEYNYNHLLIAANLWYQRNLKELLSLCMQRKISSEVFEESTNQEFLKLLPLVNLTDEFGTKEMLDILKHSEQILTRLSNDFPSFDGSLESILNKFHQVLRLSKIYSHTTEELRYVLGENTIEKILRDNGATKSSDPKDYAEIYIQMLKEGKKKIPPLSGTYQNYTYESGNMSDTMRLLMGCNCRDSCLAPEGAGEKAFIETLTKKNADILLIKGEEGEFIARTLLFRKGNYIIASSIRGENGLYLDLYNKEFLSQIANELLIKAKDRNDKIDYVFLTRDARMNLEDFTLIMNARIVEDLPHADWFASSYLIGGNENRVSLAEDTPCATYDQTRENIRTIDELTVEDIKKIKALEIMMCEDESKALELKANLNNIDFSEYEEIYKGQDWYMALKKDGSEEMIVLPTKDERQTQEINITRDILKGEGEVPFVKSKK